MTDEARKCVEALRFKEDFECIECPIPAGNCNENCMLDVAADMIESLSEQLEQAKRERDAYLKSIEGLCAACKKAPFCILTPVERCKNWQWRGVEVEG